MRVLIVDDHELIQNALISTLRELDATCEVEAATCLATASAMMERAVRPHDLVLLDLTLPDSHGLDGLSMLRHRFPGVPVVVVSSETNRTAVVQAINLGAMGFIPKTTPGGMIVNALKTVISGGIYLPAEILRESTMILGGLSTATNEGVPCPNTVVLDRQRRSGRGAEAVFTKRQSEVLELLLRGLPTKHICRELDLSEATVKTHLKSIFAALGVHNRTQAVIVASELGLQYRSSRPA